jgi:hypothetical protein
VRIAAIEGRGRAECHENAQRKGGGAAKSAGPAGLGPGEYPTAQPLDRILYVLGVERRGGSAHHQPTHPQQRLLREVAPMDREPAGIEILRDVLCQLGRDRAHAKRHELRPGRQVEAHVLLIATEEEPVGSDGRRAEDPAEGGGVQRRLDADSSSGRAATRSVEPRSIS